ncbi:hypothetical protein [Psychromonas arctica]|uniref:hypothetical protein n=1 Tax=Psychromonas arctica TaxID=168275 RepID=UPI002FD01555
MIDKIVLVVLGGVVGFSLTLLKDSIAMKKAKSVDSNYLAIVVSTSLERFIAGCCEVVCDKRFIDQNGYTHSKVSTPSFDPLLLDVEWKVLPPALLYKLLSLPEHINEANVYIGSVSDHVASPPDFDEYFEARVNKYSYLGLQAIKMSEELRELGNLPKRKVIKSGDHQIFLNAIQELEQKEHAQREFQTKMFNSAITTNRQP